MSHLQGELRIGNYCHRGISADQGKKAKSLKLKTCHYFQKADPEGLLSFLLRYYILGWALKPSTAAAVTLDESRSCKVMGFAVMPQTWSTLTPWIGFGFPCHLLFLCQNLWLFCWLLWMRKTIFPHCYIITGPMRLWTLGFLESDCQ